MDNTVEVIVKLVDRRDNVKTVRKGFATEAAANSWIDTQDKKGTLLRVLAWSE